MANRFEMNEALKSRLLGAENAEQAASVEPKSWCDSNDSCIWWDVTYDHEPANVICPKCGAFMYVNWVDYDPNPSNDTYHYKCKNCGTEKSY